MSQRARVAAVVKPLSAIVVSYVDAAVEFSDRHTPITMACVVVFITVTLCATLITTTAINRSTRP